jgi:hypothetical protein
MIQIFQAIMRTRAHFKCLVARTASTCVLVVHRLSSTYPIQSLVRRSKRVLAFDDLIKRAFWIGSEPGRCLRQARSRGLGEERSEGPPQTCVMLSTMTFGDGSPVVSLTSKLSPRSTKTNEASPWMPWNAKRTDQRSELQLIGHHPNFASYT